MASVSRTASCFETRRYAALLSMRASQSIEGFQKMKDNVKRVFYVRYVAHPCYLDIIAQRPEIRLDKLENESSDDVVEAIMAAAHAYQIGSSRDELQPRFYARRELLARMSNLPVVSTNGARVRTL